jgi:hypothetical protein
MDPERTAKRLKILQDQKEARGYLFDKLEMIHDEVKEQKSDIKGVKETCVGCQIKIEKVATNNVWIKMWIGAAWAVIGSIWVYILLTQLRGG